MTARPRRSPAAAAGVAALVSVLLVALSGCFASPDPAGTAGGRPDGGTTVDWGPLPERQVSAGITSRLAADETPPTNRWYSGLVFGDEPQAVYPYPLAFRATGSSFSVELPAVSVTATTIAASAGAGLVIGTEGSAFAVTRHDPVSVTLEYRDDSGPVGETTIAEGWPVVGFVAHRDTTLSTPGPLVAEGDGAWSIVAHGRTYGVFAPDGEVSGDGLRLGAGASAQWFAVPEDSSIAAWTDALGEPVADVETSFDLTDSASTTRLRYVDAGSTVLVAAPGQDSPSCTPGALGTFATAYGSAVACAAGDLTWSVPRLTPAASFDLGDVDGSTREQILAALRSDLADTPALPSDTYGAGKALARIGSLGCWRRAWTRGTSPPTRRSCCGRSWPSGWIPRGARCVRRAASSTTPSCAPSSA